MSCMFYSEARVSAVTEKMSQWDECLAAYYPAMREQHNRWNLSDGFGVLISAEVLRILDWCERIRSESDMETPLRLNWEAAI